MKTSIVCITIFAFLCFCTSAFSQINNPNQNINKARVTSTQTKTAAPASADKQSAAKPAATASTAKTQAAKSQAAKNTNAAKPVPVSLDKQIDVSLLSGSITFEQAIGVIRNSTKPPTQIVVMWRQLEQADIMPQTPIKVEGLSKATIGTALKMILNSATDNPSEVDFWAEDGMIVVGSKQSKDNTKSTKLYDVQDISSPPSVGGAVAFGGAAANGMTPMTGMNGMNGVNQMQGAGVGAGLGSSGYGGYGGGYGTRGGGYGGMGGGGYGGMGGGGYGMSGMGGMGGYGMGGMGGMMGGMMGGGGIGMAGSTMGGMNNVFQQQQLKQVIRTTIKPGTWNP
jgi:hypothetical protein